MSETDLKKKILEHMTVNYANALDKSFNAAKELFRITSTGTIDVLNKDRLKGTDKIRVYLIGKRYAKEAGLAQTEFVSNKELCTELGIKMGSLLPWLKTLRDDGNLDSKKGLQTLKPSVIESTIKHLTERHEVKNG